MDKRTDHSEMAQIVDRNIRALLKKRQQEEASKSFQDRLADAITRFTGSMTFVFLHFLLFGGWIVINLGWIPGIRPFDKSFVILAMIASVEAIFLSTFILISQNRMQALADKRADLDLQVSLLAEHEITRMFLLVKQMAHKMGIEESQDPELEELLKDVKPEQVLARIEEHQQK
ncbi:MAG: DUF1003 domain-containing protein [Verrucomicrobiota bacterium]|nr:DUF1003 domain-containing protein [Verrucomicrobiota bacterium]